MSIDTPVAVTGAHGRLGRALVAQLEARGVEPLSWSRPAYDLDDPGAAARSVERDRPATVIHAAAWTDVDGCAREPQLAQRRNGVATGELARACAAAGVRLLVVSTNEVFDGLRTDGEGYAEDDIPAPPNAYGESKLAGERQAMDAFDAAGRAEDLLIVRTAWLFGPPGSDFPAKILAAADRLPAGEPLGVVADEIGSPTYSVDLARAIVALLAGRAPAGIHHLVNAGRASRLELARHVLRHCRPARATRPISRHEFARASSPPAWAVLRSTRETAPVAPMRHWRQAVDAYAPSLCPA